MDLYNHKSSFSVARWSSKLFPPSHGRYRSRWMWGIQCPDYVGAAFQRATRLRMRFSS